ncbi:NAD-dependent epimerase/dehydratase family protein [Nocardia uniformis]|uniref:NAD-dependent epimerase/dehydratase family protein n=1 Tax=Nocardia uniformis TaxID=53432 RepID=A0A849C024_9NOCA|nr:NAD-dependent epimerase/dehydratase family protein [Nocardia uniformis]NNH70786.1 NAD-dependent epimerase/dehydratase family protein [Nocardia uniformis]
MATSQRQADWTGISVLVTGGAGFIGSHLVELLVEAGARVTVLDTFASGSRDNLAAVAEAITLRELDIRRLDWAEYLTANPVEVIFHLAANAYVPPSVESPAFDCELNFTTTFRLLDALRGLRWPGRLVFASSAAVYGNSVRIPISEDDPTVPISPYGVGKLAAERYLAVFANLYGLQLASVRFFSAFGPRQRKQVVFDLLAKLDGDRERLFIHGDGTQVRDFLFVADAARSAMIVAANAPLRGEAYNVGAGREYTIDQLAKSLCEITGVHPVFDYSGANRPGDPEKLVVDISRLRSIGYRPRVDFEQGLASTVAWYESLTGVTWQYKA